tara:strand:+ start:343 stop:540 length:198 start_codon:yes stop_codon:yes gene_type:complete
LSLPRQALNAAKAEDRSIKKSIDKPLRQETLGGERVCLALHKREIAFSENIFVVKSSPRSQQPSM